MKSVMDKNFIKCGIIGWCMEVLFTSACCFRKKDYKLIGQTSIWMFPIYGMAAVIKPISIRLKKRNKKVVERGLIYTAGIYITEYATGTILKKHNQCPWDYSKSRYNLKGIIRWDYAPLWFLVGLIYEKILSNNYNIKDNTKTKRQQSTDT